MSNDLSLKEILSHYKGGKGIRKTILQKMSKECDTPFCTPAGIDLQIREGFRKGIDDFHVYYMVTGHEHDPENGRIQLSIVKEVFKRIK